MDSEDKRELVPQAEEDIQEAVWMSEEEIIKTVYPKTYISIRDLLETFLLL